MKQTSGSIVSGGGSEAKSIGDSGGQTSERIASLDKEVAFLQEELDFLERKLDIVLAEQKPEDPGNKQEEPILVPLAYSIYEISQKVSQAKRQLISISDRLEL